MIKAIHSVVDGAEALRRAQQEAARRRGDVVRPRQPSFSSLDRAEDEGMLGPPPNEASPPAN